MDTINRISKNTQFGNKKLLNGEAGINGVTSNNNVTFLNATQETDAGSYTVNVTTRGERGTYTAGTAQTQVLANDETLVINDVAIELNKNMSQAQVIERINDYFGQTGVVADLDGTATRLYTDAFGVDASFSVVSNQAAAVSSSGFGTTEQTDVGVDAVVSIGGNSYTADGDVVTADTGSEIGITLAIGVDVTTPNPTRTETGALGAVAISDNSLSFQIGPTANQNAQIAVNKSSACSLGIGVAGNQFANLGEIKVSSAVQANDSLAVIDDAIDMITNLRGNLGAFQMNTLTATANILRVTLEKTINAESVIRDTDFAQEVSEFTRQQVLQQSRVDRLTLQRKEITDQQTAFKNIEGKLFALRGSMRSLLRITNRAFDARTTEVSDESAIEMSASVGAPAGTYRVRVNQLTQAHQIKSDAVERSSDLVGTGTLTFRVGNRVETDIVVEEGTTLDGLASIINA